MRHLRYQRHSRGLHGLLGAGCLALLGAGLAGCAEPAQAGGTWVEVSPARVSAGNHLTLRASCDDSAPTALATSPAFGTVTLKARNTLLLAEALVRPTTPAGVHDVTLRCGDGQTATTTVLVRGPRAAAEPAPAGQAAAARSMTGPHTGGGFLATGGHAQGSVDLRDRAGVLAGPRGWFLGGFAALAAAAVLARVPAGPARRSARRRWGSPR